MPISDRPNNGPQERVSEPNGPEIEPIDLLPGYTFQTDPPTAETELPQLTERLNRADEVIGQAVGNLRGAMVGPIDNAREVLGQAESILRGQIGAKIDRVDQSLNKAIPLVKRAMWEPIQRAYNYLLPLGIQVPGPEQNAYANATGDYLGAFGLKPPSYQIESPTLGQAPDVPELPAEPGQAAAMFNANGQAGLGQAGTAPQCVDLKALRFRPSWTNGGVVETAPGTPGELLARPQDIPRGQCGYEYTICAAVGNQTVPYVVVSPSNSELAVAVDGGAAIVTSAGVPFTPIRLWPGSVKARKVCNLAPEPPGPGNGGGGSGSGGGNEPGFTPGCVYEGMSGFASTPDDVKPIAFGGQSGYTPWLNFTSQEQRDKMEFDCWLPFCAKGNTNTVDVLGKGLPGGGELWAVYNEVFYTMAGHRPYVSPDGFTIGSFTSPPAGWLPALVQPVACVKGPNVQPPGPDAGSEQCPIPPKVVCPGDKPPGPRLELDGSDFCESIAKMLSEATFTKEDVKAFLTIGSPSTTGLPGAAGALLNTMFGQEGVIQWGLRALSTFIGDALEAMNKNASCKGPAFAAMTLWGGVLGFLQRWTGIVPQGMVANHEYAINTSCQWQIPSAPEADGAYLANEISRELWECYQKAAGRYIEPAEKVMHAKRGRVTPDWLVRLKMRGRIPDAELGPLLRKEGYIDDGDAKRLQDTLEAWPGMDDVIRFLVRDVDDAGIVQRFGMDDGFRAKWGEKLADYGRGAGVSEELAKLYWRAHWRLPSPTQLYEMAQRLRPGRVEKGLEVTLDDLKTALTQDDLLPFWIPREIAIAYRPLTRTDAKASFQVRAITDEEFKEQLQDVGYSKDDADKLFALEDTVRRKREAQQSGLPTVRGLAAQFADGALTEADYRDLLAQLAKPPEAIDVAVKNGQTIRRTKRRATAIKANKQGYLTGVLDDWEAQNNMLQVGLAPDVVVELVAEWRELRKARGKMAPASMLCTWRWRNLINAAQHQTALERVGWSPEDARKIVLSCEFDLSERAQRQAEAAAERERRRREREEKEAAKRERERLRLERLNGQQTEGSSQPAA